MPGGVITITGATGMGKSRLAFEALEGTSAQVIVVRAEPYGAASAYRVFRDPVRRLLGLERDTPEAMGQALLATLGKVAPDLLPMAPLLADVVQVDVPSTPEVDQLDPQYRPDRLADAVVRLVDGMMPGPLVLVAEEAHWADGASARLLDRIAAASSGRPWAVIAVRRGEDGGFAPAAGTHVTLEPLPADVMERLVIAATEATPLRPHEIAAVVDRAQGNPLFVEEVTRVALSTGSLDTLPESVQAAMSAQIDLLHPDARRVLRYCAVLGRSFRVEVLRRTLATDGLVADASTLSSLRRVPPAGRPRPVEVPQQPRPGRRLRGARLQDPQPPAPRRRRDAGGDEHRPRRRLPDAGTALLAGRRRRAYVEVRAAGGRTRKARVRERGRSRAV